MDGIAEDADPARIAREGEDVRLRAALAAVGLDAEAAATAVEVIRAELAQTPKAPAPHSARHKDGDRLLALADVIPQLIWHSANEGQWIWASPSWLAYTGQSNEESLGRGWLDPVHPDDRDATLRAWHEAPQRGGLDVEHRIRRALDGAWRLHHTRSAPLFRTAVTPGKERGVTEWVGSSADVEDVRRMEGEQRALLLEVQHRTRNILAVVAAIARRSLPPNAVRNDFAARIACLGRVQGFLARSGAWSVPLRDLVEAELRALGNREADRAEVVGPEVELPGVVVQPIALALHELAANAAKHGAIAQPSGHIAVTWRLDKGVEGARRLVIEWHETGVAMPEGPLLRRFGCEVIERTVPHQLQGEARLERRADGVRCRLALPFGSRETMPHRPDRWTHLSQET
ncbi:sensor histidine kinase [Roseomonas sp. KE2513]|uniref:sensor histidine kinase n=1 Tax=Roseomonas sp. KE2513 TaxID=2479202 RepID=UPI0018DFFEA2|nr:HWE histidine kinase domain-containing protein [Roseomonas sp. KE2513]